MGSARAPSNTSSLHTCVLTLHEYEPHLKAAEQIIITITSPRLSVALAQSSREACTIRSHTAKLLLYVLLIVAVMEANPTVLRSGAR